MTMRIIPLTAALFLFLFLIILFRSSTTTLLSVVLVDAAFLAAKSSTTAQATSASASASRLQKYWRQNQHHHPSSSSTFLSSFSRLYETKNNGNVDVDERGGSIRVRRRRLVIVGGGIGGLSSAYDARHILKDAAGVQEVAVIVVSDQANFSFTPSNPWIATRKRQPRDIQLPLNQILPRHGIEFLHDAVTRLEPGKNRLWLQKSSHGKQWLDYDYLIIATGPRLAFEEIPGLSPLPTTTTTTTTAASSSICTTPHALHTADLVDALQQNHGPIVVGATQGASCFGPAYEFILMLHHELTKRGGKALVDACRPMTFVTSEPYLGHLGLNGAGDSRQVMELLFAKHGIEFMRSTRTVKASPTSVTVERLDEETGKVLQRKVLPSKLTMLIPPFHGQDVWKRVPNLTDEKGLVVVNEYQQNPTYTNIFAVGVAVSIPNTIQTLLRCGVPKTGYLIESQGTAAIRNIKTLLQAAADDNKSHDDDEDHHSNNSINNHVQLRSRPLLNALCITDFGNDGAIFVTLPQIPPRRIDVTIHGKVATLAKIAFEKCVSCT